MELKVESEGSREESEGERGPEEAGEGESEALDSGGVGEVSGIVELGTPLVYSPPEVLAPRLQGEVAPAAGGKDGGGWGGWVWPFGGRNAAEGEVGGRDGAAGAGGGQKEKHGRLSAARKERVVDGGVGKLPLRPGGVLGKIEARAVRRLAFEDFAIA